MAVDPKNMRELMESVESRLQESVNPKSVMTFERSLKKWAEAQESELIDQAWQDVQDWSAKFGGKDTFMSVLESLAEKNKGSLIEQLCYAYMNAVEQS